MANKKFYYRNKSKSAAKDRLEQQSKALENFSEEQLTLTLADLGLSEATAKLLSDNGITTAAGLVVRSEKDMYKVQGLNKRMLSEVTVALKAHGMGLYVDQTEQEADKADRKPVDEQPAQAKDGRPSSAKAQTKEQSNPQGAKDKRPSDAKNPQKQGAKQDKRAVKEGGEPQKPKQERRSDERGSRFGLADRRGDSQKQAAKPARQEKITEPLPLELWHKVLKGGKWGFTDGIKTVIPPMYDEVFMFKEGLASVEIDGKCGYIDSENNVVIPLDYDLAMSFSEGLAMVAKGEKCGYIDKNNVVVIDFMYDAASPFENGEAKVKKDGKWATITPDGTLTWI